VVSGTVRVSADRDVCIGAGNCVLTAPQVFDQDDDGIVVLLAQDAPAEEAGKAVHLCPSGALRIDEG
jgi:ferredoxin